MRKTIFSTLLAENSIKIMKMTFNFNTKNIFIFNKLHKMKFNSEISTWRDHLHEINLNVQSSPLNYFDLRNTND